jgi:uncharacterized membrane protein
MMIMVSNRKLNRAMLIIAVVLNSFLVWIYWTYAPVVFADNNTTATRCNQDCSISVAILIRKGM